MSSCCHFTTPREHFTKREWKLMATWVTMQCLSLILTCLLSNHGHLYKMRRGRLKSREA